MLFQSISSSNVGFTGKRVRIDEAIVQDDKTVRDFARKYTLHKVNDQKHKKINNALWYSIPIASGLAAAVLTRGKATMFGKELSGLGAKVANGIKGAVPWAVTLGIASSVGKVHDFLRKESPTIRNNENKHPFMSFIGLLGVGVAAIMGGHKGLGALYSKIGPKTMAKLAKCAGSAGKTLNKIKTPKFIKNIGSSISKHTPSAIKSAAKTLIYNSPDLLLIGALFHSINHNYNRSNEFNKNYSGMKEAQLNLAKARVIELKMENDFLHEFPENVENIALLKKPLKDMPDDVIEKIEVIKGERIAHAQAQADDCCEE